MNTAIGTDLTIECCVNTRALPTLPATAFRLLELARQDSPSTDEIAALVRLDPAIADRLMTTANSALLAFRPKVETIEDAVNKLGMNMLRTIMLSFYLVRHQFPGKNLEPVLQKHWRSSLTQAVLAELIAGQVDQDPATCFLAGMMQDIGILGMLNEKPDVYVEQVLGMRDFPDVAAAEASLFGFSHAEVSVEIVRKWGLSSQFEEAILNHHAQFTPIHDENSLTSVAHAASLGALAILSENKIDRLDRMNSWINYLDTYFSLNHAQIEEIIADTETLVGSYAALFQFDIGQPVDEERTVADAKSVLQTLAHQSQLQLENNRREKCTQPSESAIYRDPLSGLLNRRYLNEFMCDLLEESVRSGGTLAILFIDLDDFKEVNDSLGHRCGDEVIVHVAKWLHKSIRRNDVAVRIGGDEFLVLLRDTPFTDFEKVANRIAQKIPSLKFGDRQIDVGMSAGGIFYSPARNDVADPNWLIEQADQSMYVAKRSSRGTAVVRKLPGRAC
ncbi:MAG: GGDEF domain-containing protein [Planctomycetota bacterium]